jgi:hypothetical protein
MEALQNLTLEELVKLANERQQKKAKLAQYYRDYRQKNIEHMREYWRQDKQKRKMKNKEEELQLNSLIEQKSQQQVQ